MPNAAAPENKPPWQSCPALPAKLMFKNINWKNIGTIVVVVLVVVFVIAPLVKPFAQKLPFIGPKIRARRTVTT